MKKSILLAVVMSAAVLSGCSDSDGAIRTLENNGYTHVTTHGHAFFSCAESDTFATKFKATSPNGTRVTGAVCSGLLKGSTIRFD